MEGSYPSLDRYLRTRGSHLLGHSLARAGLIVQATLGGVFLVGGVALALSTLFGASPDLLPASCSMLIPGAINLGVALGLRRRFQPVTPVDVDLTPDARTLLLTVYRELVGWPSAMPFAGPLGRIRGTRLGQRRLQRRLARRGFSQAMPEPGPEVYEKLNLAAAQHNRVAAVLATAKHSPAIAKMAPRVSAAADEAMATILDHAATLCRYPEGTDAGRNAIEAQSRALEEMANRLEAIASTQSPAVEGTFSRLDGVLEDLRLEQLARSELREEPSPESQRSS